MYSYDRILADVVDLVRASYPRQILDPARPDDGAFVNPEYGRPAPDATSHAHDLASACYAYFADGSPLAGDDELRDRIVRAIGWLRRAQRPTGLIDLIISNYESPPDTAFTVQLLAPIVAAARKSPDDGAQRIAADLGEYLRTASLGIIDRGFHTPNHRWVICSALVQAMALYPDLPAADYVARIMAEGIDINADGEFTERSSGIYNAVCDRSLRFMADGLGRPDLLDPVRKNLDLMLRLLHADGSVVTTMSIRQDRGTDVAPTFIADSFFDMAMRDGNGVWAAAADMLVASGARGRHTARLFEPFLSHPEYRGERVGRKPLPAEFHAFMPAARMLRVRRGGLSATAVAGDRNAFSLRYGEANLRALRVFGSYILAARFSADEFTAIADGVRMVHHGERNPRVQYHLPLGREVTPATWVEAAKDREWWKLPLMDITLDVREVPGGFDLHLRTEGGIDGITFEIELCFDGPGEWETADQVIRVSDGQTAILKGDWGMFRAGAHAIRVGPGEMAHRMWEMRNSDPELGSFRVVIPMETPIDRPLAIRCGTWSPATGELVVP